VTNDLNGDCDKCSYRCAKCEINPSICSECATSTPVRLGLEKSCDCPDGYYDDGKSGDC
jgi:hypothetical protein